MKLGENRFDWYKDKWPPHIEIGNGLSISPNISYSKAKQIHECPKKYAYAREIKPFEIELAYPIRMGTIFDGLCSYGMDALTEDPEVVKAIAAIDTWDVEKIVERYKLFLPDRPEGEVQVPLYKIIKGWMLMGFADMVVTMPDEAIRIVDWKWAMNPWSKNKFDANRPQGVMYCYAFDAEYASFIVANDKTTKIQGLDGKFGVFPTPQDLAAIENFIVTAIQKIESGERVATPSGTACKWCDYKSVCTDAMRG